MLTEHSKVPSEQKKRDFFPAKNPVDARQEVVNLDWDKTFKDAFATDVEVADLENGIQIENLFAFGK